ncbi:hydrogenase nickel incorporation protein HypB [Azonexus hydrophilus]|jgi:hydrogenase nickel incorporation protein HypB|uniref:Hydrogenase maturation factor HypB n=1 Tax=Azonexus hydrophilus TaxID=418702 RepID=A0ABZ2XL77_9RHOO|nr:hydrogenase nickel incorporation protein HypB [Azonexus hydrophilus]MBS4018525.1 hydrogenase nickel incorporation protein HypB [Dechloromonas sp.]
MCTVCGCGDGEVKIEGEAHAHRHVHADGTVHEHGHAHDHEHAHSHDGEIADAHGHAHTHADGTTHVHEHVHHGEHAHPHDHGYRPQKAAPGEHGHSHDHHHHGDLDYGSGPARAHVPGMSQARMVQIERDILSKNDGYAAKNRAWFDEHGVFALNLVSSPGSGKTTLLVKTIEALQARLAIAVVEGDQQTTNDAERIRATGAPALQINTGKGCHLDAHMVGHAMERLQPADGSLFLIENVGNLVCPAAFDLGEQHKVAILSVTEGEDKPLKYPDMFAAADVMLLNKCDLLPYLQFDADLAEANARRVNPKLTVFRVSATSGEGMADWLAWIEAGVAGQRARLADNVAALKARIADLERQLAAK